MKGRSRIIGSNILLSSFLLFVGIAAYGQSKNDSIAFISHLSNLGAYDEALHYLNIAEKNNLLGEDSLHYLRGKFLYRQKSIVPSIESFRKVSSASKHYSESQLLSAYQIIYSGNWVQGRNEVETIDFRDSIYDEAKFLLVAGTLLLERDLSSFDEKFGHISDEYRQFAEAKQQLTVIRRQLTNQKIKSPFVAGLLSTLVPGLGHFYNGNIGRGSMTLITVGIFGLQALESYQRDGIKSVRTVLFGSLFSGFYIANILGSSLAVKVKKDEFNDQVNESILVSMHIPLRYLFD